jgi:predicted DNA-binding ribbon-helix-helix protein
VGWGANNAKHCREARWRGVHRAGGSIVRLNETEPTGQIKNEPHQPILTIRGQGVVVKSLVVKRSIIVAGNKTSVSLEDAFWKAVKEIATFHGTTVSNLVSSIDTKRGYGNLSSAIRLFVLDFYRGQTNKAPTARDSPLTAVNQTGSI